MGKKKPETVGQRIRQERRKREWTQEFLGKCIGVDAPTICRIELGHADITTGDLQTIAEKMAIPVTAFYRRAA